MEPEKTKESAVTYQDWYGAQLQTKERFENLHKQIQAIQDKQPEILEALLQKYVNGKIDKIGLKLDTYIKEDNEWKYRANPTVDLGNNVRGFGKVMVYLLGIGAGIFGVLKAIAELKK